MPVCHKAEHCDDIAFFFPGVFPGFRWDAKNTAVYSSSQLLSSALRRKGFEQGISHFLKRAAVSTAISAINPVLGLSTLAFDLQP